MSADAGEVSPPGLFLKLLESRAVTEFGAYCWTYPWFEMAPRGDGHPVLVLPGFLASGSSTLPLRHFLKRLGYKGHRWKLGRNLGGIGQKEREILARVRELRRRYRQRVSLIGWSLGGVYARELAWMAPDDIRQIITLGTPFRHSRATSVTRLYEDISGQREAQMPPELAERIGEPPPVPSTSIYSRSDGVVAWRCSLEKPAPRAENIRVFGSHCGLGHNPLALWAIADRLAQPEGAWRPFAPGLTAGLWYPRADILESV